MIPAFDAFNDSGGTNLVPFSTHLQGRVGGASDIDGNPIALTGINSDYEITTVGLTQSVPFFFDSPIPSDPSFYIAGISHAPLPSDYVWFTKPINGTPAADDLAGTGFNGGTRILAARVTGGGNTGAANTSSLQLFDQLGGDDYPGLQAPSVSSSFENLIAKVTWVHPDYFPGLDLAQTPLEFVQISRGQNHFDLVNPSARFIDQAGSAEGATPVLAGAGNPGELGAVNGSLTSGGTGMQFQFYDPTVHFEEILVIDKFSDGEAETFVSSGVPMRTRQHFDLDGSRGLHRQTILDVSHNITATASFVVDPLNSATLTVDGNPGDTVKLTLDYLLFNPDLDLTDEGTLGAVQVVLDENGADNDIPVTLRLQSSNPGVQTSQSMTKTISPSQTTATFDFGGDNV